MTAILRSSLGHVRDAAWPVAQTAEMLVGVTVGVIVGELLVLVLGMGALQVVLAAAAAMLTVAAVMYSSLPLIQAGGSAVLVVALQSPESGGERMLDALVGGGVALFVSQILLPPSPVSLLKDAGREALGSIAEGLRVSARALSDGDATAAGTSLECLREEGWGSMASLAAARKTSGKVARRTLRGRREAGRFERLEARLGEIDLLFEGGLLLTRAVDPRVALVAEGVHLVASGLLRVAAPEGAGLEPAD